MIIVVIFVFVLRFLFALLFSFLTSIFFSYRCSRYQSLISVLSFLNLFSFFLFLFLSISFLFHFVVHVINLDIGIVLPQSHFFISFCLFLFSLDFSESLYFILLFTLSILTSVLSFLNLISFFLFLFFSLFHLARH